MGIDIKLAGSVAIEGADGRRHQLSSAQAQVAMARLTMERRGGTTRDQLADALWPDGLPNTWASALRSVVSRVRAFLAGAVATSSDPLVAEGGRYMLRLPDDVAVDVEGAGVAVADAKQALEAGSFAEARELATAAVSCLRMPFLPDHDGDWVASVRQHLADLLVTGLETASLALSALQDHGDALVFANEAIARAPLRESAHRCRMSAHLAAGNRAEALRSYQQLRRMLAEELGVDPAPETEAAYLALLGTPSSCPARAEGGVRPGPASALPFVGRGPDLDALADAWAQAGRGTSHMVLLTGEPGIGKTRLATEAAHRVTVEGGLVLCGRCDRGSIVAYQPFVEALGGYVASTPPDALPALAPGTLETLASLFPALEHPAGGAPSPTPVELLAALTDLTVRLARQRPVLVVLDDIHLAEAETLLLLRRLVRQSAGTSLLIVATACDDAMRRPEPFADLVQELEREGWLARARLEGLSEPDVRTLVRHVLADVPPDRRPAAHRLLADTGGNTFLLLELLGSCRDGDAAARPAGHLPAGIHDYAAARLAALAPAPRDLLRAAAFAGVSFELDLVAHAAGLAPEPALDALEALLGAGLLAEGGSGSGRTPAEHRYRFAHEILRRAVYDQVSDARRRSLHARQADAIEQLRADDLVHYTPVLAHHRAAGAPLRGDQHAVRWSWRAAAWASERRTPNEAVRFCRQALDHVPPDDHSLRAEALTNLGVAQTEAGQAEGEQALLDGAIHARRCGRLDIAARAALGLANVVATRPQLREEAAALLDDVLALASSTRVAGRGEGRRPGSLDALTHARLVARDAQLGGRAAAEPRTAGSAMRALSGELRRVEGPEHVDRRLTLADELLAVANGAAERSYQVLAAHHRAMAAEMAGKPAIRDEALAAVATAAGDGTLLGDTLLGDALLGEHEVAVAVTEGRFADAAVTAKRVTPLAGAGGISITPAPGSLASRQMLIAGWLQAGTEPAWRRRAGGAQTPLERALVALIDGDRGRAHLTARAFAAGVEPLPPGDEWLHAAGVLALAAVELGDPATGEAVRRLLTPYADLTCSVGYRSFVGPVALHLGRLAYLAGDWAEAERHFMSALRHLAARQARPWIALTQLALARTLEARGRPGDRRWLEALSSDARWIVTQLGLLPRCQVRTGAVPEGAPAALSA